MDVPSLSISRRFSFLDWAKACSSGDPIFTLTFRGVSPKSGTELVSSNAIRASAGKVVSIFSSFFACGTFR